MAVIEEQFQTIGGYATYYLTAGSGHPLVLVHGVGGSSLTFRWNMEELSERYRVYALDLPGHGRSEKPDIRYAAEDSVPFLITFLEQVVGGPAALVGVSAGGLMCALLAAERPDLVTHLVMVSSAGLGRDIDWGLRLLSLPVARPWLENARREPNVIRMSMRRIVHDPTVITEDVVAAVAASVVKLGIEHKRAVGYIGAAGGRQVLNADIGDRQYHRVLTELALAQPAGGEVIANVIIAEVRRFDRNRTPVVVTASTDPGWIDALHGMTERGVRPIAVFVDPATFDPSRDSSAIHQRIREMAFPIYVVDFNAGISEGFSLSELPPSSLISPELRWVAANP